MINFSQRLLIAGLLLFFGGLLSGLVIAEMPNARMGLAAHLEGVMNGTFLIVIGLAWHRMALTLGQQKLAFWLLIYGTYNNVVMVQAAAVLGTSEMTPIAGAGYTGTAAAELFVSTGLVTVAFAMIVALVVLILGAIRIGRSHQQ